MFNCLSKYNSLYIAIISLFLLFSCFGVISVVAQDTNSLSSLVRWDNQTYQSTETVYREKYSISFRGTNISTNSLKIHAIVPDCRSCVNLKSSLTEIPPNHSFEVTGEVFNKASGKPQRGQVAVLYQGVPNPDILRYSLEIPHSYLLSPPTLVWGSDRSPQTLVLKLNVGLGISYHSFRVDSPDFEVVIKETLPDTVVFEVTPVAENPVRGAIFVSFNVPSPENPQNEVILHDKVFSSLVIDR
jgi:hypothetical protein